MVAPPVPMTSNSAFSAGLEARNIRKCFGPVAVLDGVTIHLPRGQIHALLGQNGAGKSTLVKILTGVYPTGSFEGALYLGGRSVTFRSPADAKRCGVAYVPQEIRLFDELSVAENVLLGNSALRRRLLMNHADASEQTRRIFQTLGQSIDPGGVAGALRAAERQLVAIARALAENASLIVLDEPTTSLTPGEVDVLMKVLKRIAEHGTAILYVTHRLAEVRELCDSSTVLRDGRIVLTRQRASFDQDEIVTAMMGRPIKRALDHRAMAQPQPQPIVLDVRDLSVKPSFRRRRVDGVTLSVRRGEILGVCGLLGSGRTELLHAIFGRAPCTGQIHVAGRLARIETTKDARKYGIALLTEERQRDGLLFNLPVGENITVGTLSRFAIRGVVQRAREECYVAELLEKLRVKTRGPKEAVQNLSGGNQQKLLMARVLSSPLEILLLDEPTKGVDIAVKLEIHDLVRKVASDGVAVLLVSSDLDEIFQVADRCITLCEGRVVDSFIAAEGSQHRVIQTITSELARRGSDVAKETSH
jgi:ribose transport system ATP-binding protein